MRLAKILSIDHERSAFVRYSIALGVSTLALLLKLKVHYLHPNAIPAFFLALALSSVYGGRGPGILSAIFITLSNLYFFIPPVNSFYISTVQSGIEFVVFTVGVLLIAALTSSLYEAREKAKIASQKAIQYAQQKSHFIANVTHEIRTPINAVIGLSDLLADFTEIPKEAQSYVAKIQDSSESLLALVDDILDFSKLEFGKMSLANTPFSLRETIEKTVGLLTPASEKKGISLTWIVDPKLPEFLKGDPSKISQIISNLLSNAIKFTEAGGVQVLVAEENRGESQLTLKVEVTDSGIGISKDQQERIFEPFVQGDLSTTRRFGGTGLGLAICKNLVDQMGGTMGVRSEVDRGATFWFSVPLRTDLDLTKETEFQKEKVPEKPVNILIVEDNEISRLVMVKVLQKLGYQANAVSSGLEALDKFSQNHYDAVLMDCHMPGMDGYSTTERIRAMNIDVPIIALTAYASVENRDRCHKAGMDDYLTKPIKPEKLDQCLRSWIKNFPSVNYKLSTMRIMTLGEHLDEKTTNELLRSFTSNTPLKIGEIENALNEGDTERFKKIAHHLQSSATAVGASNMDRICKILETLDEGNPSFRNSASALILALNFEFFNTQLELSKMKRQHSAPTPGVKNFDNICL